MGGDALAEPEDLDGRCREAHVDGCALVHQCEGDRVIVTVDLDVIVDVDTGDLPLAVREGRGGQGPQRLSFDLLEEPRPAGLIHSHRSGVQLLQ